MDVVSYNYCDDLVAFHCNLLDFCTPKHDLPGGPEVWPGFLQSKFKLLQYIPFNPESNSLAIFGDDLKLVF